MILLVFVARVADSMLLVASTDSMRSSDAAETMDVYKSQARQILKNLGVDSPAKCSIESGPYLFHYVLVEGVVYLCLTAKGFPKRTVFRYLADVEKAFTEEVAADHGGDWRSAVATVGRPYAFIKFDKQLQRMRRQYANGGGDSGSRIDADLADIHDVMRRNIDEVLNRGERLDHLVETTSSLKNEAQKYKWGAKKFSYMVMWQQYAPFVAIGFVTLFVVYLKIR